MATIARIQLVLASVLLAGCTINIHENELDGLHVVRTAGKSYVIYYETNPDPIPLNEMFTIDVHVYDGESSRTNFPAVELSVDGRMPHHRHGMNTQPVITPRGEGEFFVEGMLFHMPGYWELYFDVSHDGVVERAQDSVVLD